MAFALLFLLISLSSPWLSYDVFFVDGAGRPTTTPQSIDIELGFTDLDVGAWGVVFLAAFVVAASLAFTALLVPDRTVRRVVAAAGVATALVAMAVSVAAWLRTLLVFNEAARRLNVPGWTMEGKPGYPTFGFSTDGPYFAFLAALVIGLIAACTLFPRAGSVIVASTGAVLLIVTAPLPWLVVQKVRTTSSEIEWVGFTSLGRHALASVVAGGIFCVLVLVAALRRSRAGALGLFLVNIACFLVAQGLDETLNVETDAWMPAAERAGTITVDVVTRLATQFTFTTAEVVLFVAACTAWRRTQLARATFSPDDETVPAS